MFDFLLIFVMLAGKPHCSCNRKIEKRRKKRMKIWKDIDLRMQCQMLTCNEIENED